MSGFTVGGAIKHVPLDSGLDGYVVAGAGEKLVIRRGSRRISGLVADVGVGCGTGVVVAYGDLADIEVQVGDVGGAEADRCGQSPQEPR